MRRGGNTAKPIVSIRQPRHARSTTYRVRSSRSCSKCRPAFTSSVRAPRLAQQQQQTQRNAQAVHSWSEAQHTVKIADGSELMARQSAAVLPSRRGPRSPCVWKRGSAAA